jgi:CubicO group peptidase (beta-lactamase class C family)
MAVYEDRRAAGQHEGMQLTVLRDGAMVADLAVGLAKTDVPMRNDSLVIWFSTTKVLTAAAVAQLWEQGRFQLDDPVAAHLPEFGQHGKGVVTVRHVLTHTGGFRNADGMLLGWDGEVTTEELYRRICAAGLEDGWRPGIDAGYHGSAGHVVLGELVTRLSGVPFADYLRRNILEPVGAKDFWVGIPSVEQERYGERLASMWWCQGGLHGEAPGFETVACRERAHPGMGGRGPANQLVLVLEALRRDALGGTEQVLVRPQTWDAVTARHRTGVIDKTFGTVVDWGLGVIPVTLGGANPSSSYGRHCGHRSWGHTGAQSSTAFVDPDNRLTVALMFNGMPGHEEHGSRQSELLTALYEDLGLAH